MSEKPRIAWLSPFGPKSDVGAFTRCLLPHLIRPDEALFECDLFVNQYGSTYDSPVPTMEVPSGGISEILSRYDAAIFNLGNNVENHAHIVDALRRVPGVAIMHDYSYHHFFAHRCFVDIHSPPAYARLIHDYYGSRGFNMAIRSGVITRDATLYAPWDGENVADYPLIRPLAQLAAAIVVHSPFMETAVREFFKGPILKLYLPSDQKAAPSADSISRWRAETASKERCQFTTFGHVSRAKCIDVIVQAIAQSPMLRAKSQLVVAGHPSDKEYVREIEALVVKLGLTKHVTFEYDVTNERLLAIKNESDAFLNLRFPNTEGASGSLIEMMNAGRPVIAYRAGSYADIPSDAALLIERNSGVEGVIDAMESLVGDPELRVKIGRAGAKSVGEQNSAAYARSLKTFLLDIRKDLRRRSRLVAPIRDGMAWKATDVVEADTEWFADLTHARRSLLLLERDSEVLSPEVFLTWPMDDLVAFVSRVLLHAKVRDGLGPLLVDYAQRLGRWPFYRLIASVCRRQGLTECDQASREDLAIYGVRVPDVAFWDIATRLEPERFVRMLYLGVLERGWGQDEHESWVKRIRQGMAPSMILLEFLGSAEYRQTFTDELMRDVEDWARRESAFSTGRRAAAQPQIIWPLGSVIRFNDANPTTEALLGKLWHGSDAQGRWSNGRVGDLQFHLPAEVEKLGGSLILRVRVTGTRYTGHRVAVAQHNRRELASLTIRDDSPVTWNIPLPPGLHSREGVSLVLMIDQDFSPAAGGQSADRRSLGMMLIEGRLVLSSADIEQVIQQELIVLPGGKSAAGTS